MNLYILRHAIAAHPGDPGMPDGMNDFDRPLTDEGRKKMQCAAKGIAAMDVRFDRVLSSPLVRALQTAGILMEAFGLPGRELVVTENLSPGARRKDLVREVNRIAVTAENILLVGHEPDLSGLIEHFCFGVVGGAIELKKGALAKLEVDRLRDGRCATLAWLLAPRQLWLMA